MRKLLLLVLLGLALGIGAAASFVEYGKSRVCVRKRRRPLTYFFSPFRRGSWIAPPSRETAAGSASVGPVPPRSAWMNLYLL